MPPYTREQIEAFEAANRVMIPDRLVRFLLSVGPGQFNDVEVYRPEDVRGLYEDFFDNSGVLFARYLPFGCNNRKQEVWVLDVSVSPVRYSKICHETVPDDWPEERWMPFDGNRTRSLT